MLVILLVCVFAGCVKQSNESDNDKSDSNGTSPATTEISTEFETTTEVSLLSDNCDKVLASGMDSDGNYYELVGNEEQDAFGANIEIGVIKNNKWSIPLTNKSPFIGDDGWLYGRNGNYKGSIFEEEYFSGQFGYIGNGCFCYGYSSAILLNGNNSKSFNCMTDLGENVSVNIYDFTDTSYMGDGLGPLVVNEDGKVLLNSFDNVYLLDTTTMKATKINIEAKSTLDESKLHPFSDGLFAYVPSGTEVKINERGFYNAKGKRVIDLSGYTFANDITYRSEYKHINSFVFIDGKCDLYVDNGSGAIYRVTIDKTGNVLSQEPYEE